MNVLVDTNILVRLSERSHPDHAPCVEAVSRLAQRGDTLYLCAQVAIEFWSVATRPKTSNGLGLSLLEAEAALSEADIWCAWLPEPPDIATRWRRIVNHCGVSGRQVHDARLVALMEACGLGRLLTLNTADFARYVNVIGLHPSTVK